MTPIIDLDSAHIFLTGGTGFLGQAVLERLLSSYPNSRISLLVRAKGSRAGEDRIQHLLRKPVFKVWRESVGSAAAAAAIRDRVTVITGSLDDVPALPSDIDVAIHSASTVSFDEPIHRAFSTNVEGATNLYEALLASGGDPAVVHVSTCYVGGMRKGVVPEARLEHTIDWRAECDAAKAALRSIELASRRPDVLQKFLARSRTRYGKQGPQAVAQGAEQQRVEWIAKQLVAAGRARAESLGWPDVYTLTKAFAERAAEELWADRGHRLSVVRPAIIESALEHPYPGWIDGFKVADPLVLAYGRGQLPEFPGLPDSVLDVIPVDFVVNTILAAAAIPPPVTEPRYVHIGSGASNPLPFHRMFDNVRQYFTQNPVPHGDGHVAVPQWKFPGGLAVERQVRIAEKSVQLREFALGVLPPSEQTRRWQADLAKRKADVETLRTFSELYRAYVQSEITFDDRQARALHAAIPQEQIADRGFDVTKIDWEIYLQKIHLPAIAAMTHGFFRHQQSDSRTATPPARRTLPQRTDVVAVFDLEGTVVDSNLVEQYLWVRSADLQLMQWPGEILDLLTSLPGYVRAERRDRGDFIRTFLRRYTGMSVTQLERLVSQGYRATMLEHTSADAIARVREHRAAGHRTILVTGSIGMLAMPVADLFDDVIASDMHERNGVLTGFLAKPPLVDEARAAWLKQYAEDHGFNLAASYGYGDSQSDLPWLTLLGNPAAINPDSTLSQEAQRRRWPIHQWKRGMLDC